MPKPDNVLEFKRPDRKRVIRRYRRLAFTEHGNCWHCEIPISPGDEYEGEVYVFGTRLWVRKTHYPLDCHPPDDEDTYRHWGEIRQKEEEASRKDERSALAA